MRTKSKERTKFERDFLLYPARQGLHRLQRKPGHGRKHLISAGQLPTFPHHSAAHHEGAFKTSFTPKVILGRKTEVKLSWEK